jgi:sialate O-acetylesterase
MNDPQSGLIVTIDVGDTSDIHPKDKLDVGKRTTQWALAAVYGRKITRGGPVFEKAEVKNGKIILTFADAGTGLKLKDGDKPDEFAIAGDDKKWVWAEAKIIGKNKIEVWSPSISAPAAVRYAFNNNPRHPNLINETGIPAGPFRTDNWTDPTEGKW